MSVLTRKELSRAIEVAEYNDWCDDMGGVVWDSRPNDGPYGFVIEYVLAAQAVGGFCAFVRDGVDNRGIAHRMNRLDAVHSAYLSYLMDNPSVQQRIGTGVQAEVA